MYQSVLFTTTLREAPADAEVASHQLLLRGGFIRALASGIYTYMPLGLRVLRNIEEIVRQEMNAAGAQELLMPVLQPIELWKESGRDTAYGPELIRLADRHQREFALGPTHEEVITSLVSQEVNSYRKLPVTLYQIQTKFRDERRPRFGLLRTREFLMKDAYSFDTSWDGLDWSYRKMNEAYHKIFTRLGLNYRAVEADGGSIGGEGATHEFMALASVGEDIIAACTGCSYSANIEKAEVKLPSEAQHNVSLSLEDDFDDIEKVYTPGVQSIQQLEAFFKVSASKLLKTVLFIVDDIPIAVVIRGDYEINELKVKSYLQASTITLADQAYVSNQLSTATGYVGPIGLTVSILLDYSALSITEGITGANEGDYHYIHVNVQRDVKAQHVGDFRNVNEGDACPRCEEGRLSFHRGIEMGHIFKLGTKYSAGLKAAFLNQSGQSEHMIMGCYGIGISRILSAVIEQNHAGQAVIWPPAITPYQVHLVVIAWNDWEQQQLVRKLQAQLEAKSIEVLIDDRDERAGVKFKDADLIGIPYRIVVGKDAKEGKVEWIDRMQNTKEVITAEHALFALEAAYRI